MRPATHWSCQRRAFGGAEIFRAPSHFWAIGVASAAPFGGRGDISCAQPPQTPSASVLGHWSCERRTRGGAEIFRAPSPPQTARCFNPEPLELRAARPWASGGAEIFCAPSHPRAPGASGLGHWSCDCRARGGADIFHAPSPPPPPRAPVVSILGNWSCELRTPRPWGRGGHISCAQPPPESQVHKFWAIGVASPAPVGADIFLAPSHSRSPGASRLGHGVCECRAPWGAEIFRAPSHPRAPNALRLRGELRAPLPRRAIVFLVFRPVCNPPKRATFKIKLDPLYDRTQPISVPMEKLMIFHGLVVPKILAGYPFANSRQGFHPSHGHRATPARVAAQGLPRPRQHRHQHC